MGNQQRRYRFIAFARLEMRTSFHTGSGIGDDPYSDQPVLRDASGFPFISGATLAGSLAAALSPEQRQQWLTGKERSSPLIMDDARLLPAQEQVLCRPVEIRSRNALDRHSLSVIDKSFFNLELLPAGTIFRFGCRCDFADTSELEEFKRQLNIFLGRGGFLGGGRNCGLGEWRAPEMLFRTLDMEDIGDLSDWLVALHGFVWDGKRDSLLNGLKFQAKELVPIPATGIWQLKLRVKVENGPHLSAADSGLPVKKQPDLSQAGRLKIDDAGKFAQAPELLDFGSTVRGRLRTIMEMLLRTYLFQEAAIKLEDCKNIIPSDPRKTGTSETVNRFFGRSRKGGRSPWRVSERPWREPETGVEDHIKLDEFTQQVINRAKFDFEPLHAGTADIIVTLENGEDWHKILLTYAARLLEFDILPWGGHGARGYLGARVRIEENDILPDKPGNILRNTIKKLKEENSE